jgi:hypothetical protein
MTDLVSSAVNAQHPVQSSHAPLRCLQRADALNVSPYTVALAVRRVLR